MGLGPMGGGGALPPSLGGPFASLGSYMAAAAAASGRRPFEGPGSPLMPSAGAAKLVGGGGHQMGPSPLGHHNLPYPAALRQAAAAAFAAAMSGHGGDGPPTTAPPPFLPPGLHPAIAASLHAHLAVTSSSPDSIMSPPSFQSVLASLSAYRPKEGVSPPLSVGSASPPDYAALLRLQAPTSLTPVSPPPPAMATPSSSDNKEVSKTAASTPSPPSSDFRTESINALRMKAREHELRLEMLKKIESAQAIVDSH